MNDYNKLLELLVNNKENDKCKPHESSDKSNLADCFNSLQPEPFTAVATILGFIIASRLTVSQQNSIGNFIELVGQVILTINAQGSNLQSGSGNSEISQQLDLIKKQIEVIEKQLK